MVMAPSKHLGCPLCTGRSSAQRPASLYLPHTCPCLLLSQSTGGGGTALASLLCAWIIYIFKKKLAIQVTSTDFSRTKIWAKSTVDIYGEKDGARVLFALPFWSYHEKLPYCMCNPPNWLLPEAFSFFLASGTSNGSAAWKQWSCTDSMCHLLFSSWITAGCWLCRN